MVAPATQRLTGLLLAGLLSAASAQEVLRYTDERGVVHYVDSIIRIPPEYRNQVESLLTESQRPATAPPREFTEPSSNLAELAQEEVVTRVRIIGNRVLVPVTVGYDGRTVELSLLLDTGASSTLLDREIARRLGVRDTEAVSGRVADGRTVQALRGTLDFLQVGPLEVQNIEAAFMDRWGQEQDHDGLLGMNFLRHFQYRIDFPGRLIHWSAP